MLTAYFDDSGTHDEAEIMVMAGFIGTDEQWSAFDASWKAKLDAPLPDKPPLRRFRMADCEARSGEFSGYSKAEKDAVIHDFREIIIDNKLPGYVIAVERRAWDRLVVGPHAVLYGDCEQHCVRRCVSFALDYVRKHESERLLTIVIDDSTARRVARQQAVTDPFQEFYYDHPDFPDYPKIAAVSFSSSTLTRPLQAADMLAWEDYQQGLAVFRSGSPAPPRPHLKAFADSGFVQAWLLDAPLIQGLVNMFAVGKT